MEVFEGGGPLADFTDDIFPLLIMYTVQKSGAPLDTLPGTSPVLNFLLQEKNITEATERKEQVFGLAVNLFAIRSCNLITDLVDGEIVSTCNRRDNWYGDQCDAYNSRVKYLVKSNQIDI
uniref:Uncharacterized protein n=1 Tax=Salix viminalis TaxID=40686 RepID=A0A6N2LZR6_SALVM